MANPNFWRTSLLYLYRPNLINRQVIGGRIVKFWFLNIDQIDEIITILNNKISIQELNSISIVSEHLESNEFIDKMLNQPTMPILVLRKLFRKQTLKTLLAMDDSKNNCIPNSNNVKYDWAILWPNANRWAILPLDGFNEGDKNSEHVKINIRKDDIAFAVTLIDDIPENVCIELCYLLDEKHPTQLELEQQPEKWKNHYWLENIFKPKFERWLNGCQIATSNNDNDNNDNNKKMNTIFEGSIRNVSVEKYCEIYNRLKAKYVSELMNIWRLLEKTDPIKFIYEDIAIAAYLITLWQEEMEKFSLNRKQTFSDIGCGNGLLVYILNKEGYNGYGVDVKRRNIWNYYDNNIRLIEMQIDPFGNIENGDFKLDQCDWMIGNHSDELTPWIIYMAASISPFTRAFILPCCCFDFDGFKFQRNTVPNRSQYRCYIDFLQETCKKFGFKCWQDKLRIPSTKRICLICYGRTYLPNEIYDSGQLVTQEQAEQIRSIDSQWQQKRKEFVEHSLQKRGLNRLREHEQTVHNCTRIDSNIKQEIINCLASILSDCPDNIDSYSGSVSFSEAIKFLDKKNNNLLKHLKNQCGGLQTFIRNHKHIFTIVNNRISFQTSEYLQLNNDDLFSKLKKTKECWFHSNHPKGCRLSDDNCKYKHSKVNYGMSPFF